MKKVLKILGIVIGVLVVLLVAAGLYLAFFFDPNNYKDSIISEVKKATGRDLVIEGDLSLTIFPWLGVEFGPMSLSNPEGFTAPGLDPGARFLSLEGGKGYVALLPLFSQRIEINEVVVNGLSCHLVRTENGRANWEFFAPGAPGTPAPEKSGPAPVPTGAEPIAALAVIGMNNLSLANATISLDDHYEQRQARAEQLSLELKALALDANSGAFGLRLESANGRAAVLAFSDTRAKLDARAENLAMSAAALSANEQMSIQAQNISASLAGLEYADALAGRTAHVSAFSAMLKGISLDPTAGAKAGNTEITASLLAFSDAKTALEARTEQMILAAGGLVILPPPASDPEGMPRAELISTDLRADLLHYSAGANGLNARAEHLTAALRDLKAESPDSISVNSADARATLLSYSDPRAGRSAHISGLEAQVREFFKGAGIDIRVQGLTINDTNVTYADSAQNLDLTVSKLSASVQGLVPGQKPQITASAFVDARQPDLGAEVKLALAASEASAESYKFRNIAVDVTPLRGIISPALGPVALRGNVDVAPRSMTFTFSPLSVSSQHGSVSATGSAGVANRTLDGTFTIQSAPAALLKALNMAVPTQDPNALNRLEAEITLSATPARVEISKLDARLDDSTISAVASAALGAPVKAEARLTVDTLNLDRYLPPASAAKPAQAGAPSRPAGQPARGGQSGSGQSGNGQAGGAQVPAALKQALRLLDASLSAEIGSLTVSRVPMTQIAVQARADRGLITVTPASLTVAGGTVNAALTADTRQSATRSDISVQIADVDIGQVQRLALNKEYVSSRATADISLQAAGDSVDAVKRTLGGKGIVSLGQGVLTGIQLIPQQVPGIPSDWMAKTGQVFNSMDATFTAANGVFTNKDMVFKSPLCTIAGAGSADLPKDTVDYRMTLSFGSRTHLPARLWGPLGSPHYAVDPTGLISGAISDPSQREALENLLQGRRPDAAQPESSQATPEGSQPVQEKPRPEEMIQDALRGIFK